MRSSLLLALVATAALTLMQPSTADPKGNLQWLERFDQEQTRMEWFVVNDNVMGGRSEGGFEIREDALVFRGITNTDGGGFSSIRARSETLDLSDFAGIQLNLVGDGRRYTWRLATGSRWRGIPVGYWAEFDTLAGQAQTIQLPFDAFFPQAYGRKLSGPSIDLSRINGMGIMIYDGEDGPFEIQLQSVSAYSVPPL
ncbi:MAG: CIA30 family protein [Pseudomonadota bacterium]